MKVKLFMFNRPIIECSLKYIGMLGMQVNAEPVDLEYGDKIDVEMILASDIGDMCCKIPAVITKKSPTILGMTFLFQELKTIEQLHALLERYLLESICPNTELACL